MRSFFRPICLFLLSVVSFASYAGVEDCQNKSCIAVVDAGSSGSRLHIYSYDTDATNTPTNIKEQWSKKVSPGFASLDAKQDVINSYLGNLFTGFPQQSMPVYFYATGGMRLTPQTKQQALYASLHNWFNQQVNLQLVNAKTISGNREALYDWLSVNYQLGALNSNKADTGVMDIGGASVQVAFAVPAQHDAKPDIQELELYGNHFSVFTHSFLGLGQTEASHQFLDKASCFPDGYPLSDDVQATGDANQCEKQVATLVNQVHHVKSAIQQATDIGIINNWYVLGGAVDLVKSKPFHFPANEFTNAELLSQAQEDVCGQSWNSLVAQYPGNDYLYGYCLFPAYYYALMVDGYGINAKQTIHYMDAKQAGDWTLGVVLLQS